MYILLNVYIKGMLLHISLIYESLFVKYDSKPTNTNTDRRTHTHMHSVKNIYQLQLQ